MLSTGSGPKRKASSCAVSITCRWSRCGAVKPTPRRRCGAFEVLGKWGERTRALDRRRTGLLAVAMLKREPAIAFLLSLVAEAPGPTARDAITALAVYRHDDTLVQRVRQAVEQRTDIDLN